MTIGWYGKERVDFISYSTKEIWRCYEIKISKSDFYSGAINSFIGNYNYYVMPRELYKDVKKDIPPYVGVYVPEGKKLYSVKSARKQELKIDEKILKDSMIRSLYRESEKVISNNDVLEIDRLRKELAKAKRKAYQNYKHYMNLLSKLYNKYGEDWKKIYSHILQKILTAITLVL